MSFVNFDLTPSTVSDSSRYAAKGRVVETDGVRWHRPDGGAKPLLESIGGWERVFIGSISGMCRGICAYTDTTPTPIIGLGTHTHLYAVHDSVLYDITPWRLISVLGNPFATTSGAATVTVTHASHGAAAGDQVSYTGASAINGLTLAGAYTIATVVDANSYTITAASTASGTGSGGGTVTASYQLSIGSADSLAGLGYGTGGYGSGGYSRPSSLTNLKARTWAVWPWGVNLVASPHGGGLYEFPPTFTATQYVTNGDFAAGTDWTLGAGWTIAAGIASHAAGNATALSQAVSATAGSYVRLAFDVVQTAGSIQPSLGGVAIGSAISGNIHINMCFQVTTVGSLTFTADAAFAGSIDNVSLTLELAAHLVPNAPTENLGMFVTPEAFIVLLGTTDAIGVWSPMTLRTSDQASSEVWAPLATNQARDTILRGGSRLIAGRPVRGQSLVWSDTSVFGMRYTGDPAFVYAYGLIASDCGLIGPNAVAVLDGAAYWMTPTGRFLRYAGGGVETVECPMAKDVIDNLAPVQGEKVFASVVQYPGGVEIWWDYPDFRDGNECSRYIVFNPTLGVWTRGTMARTARCSAGATPYPVATGVDGSVYYHEKGWSADGGALSWRFLTAPLEVGVGDQLMAITRMVGDFHTLVGGARLSLSGRIWPAGAASVTGPLTITATQLHADFVMAARQVQVEFSGTAAPAQMRIGAIRFELEPTGMAI